MLETKPIVSMYNKFNDHWVFNPALDRSRTLLTGPIWAKLDRTDTIYHCHCSWDKPLDHVNDFVRQHWASIRLDPDGFTSGIINMLKNFSSETHSNASIAMANAAFTSLLALAFSHRQKDTVLLSLSQVGRSIAFLSNIPIVEAGSLLQRQNQSLELDDVTNLYVACHTCFINCRSHIFNALYTITETVELSTPPALFQTARELAFNLHTPRSVFGSASTLALQYCLESPTFQEYGVRFSRHLSPELTNILREMEECVDCAPVPRPWERGSLPPSTDSDDDTDFEYHVIATATNKGGFLNAPTKGVEDMVAAFAHCNCDLEC